MSSVRRILKILYGVFLLLSAALLLIMPKEGAMIVIFVLDLALLIYGIRMFIYYFTLARYMVGGIMTLYKSMIVIDFGLFIFYLDEIPYRFMLFYLLAMMGLSGITTILSALEMKRLENHSWKFKLAYGLTSIMLVAGSLIMSGSEKIVTVVFCAGLINAACYHIRMAFKKSAIIYIG